MSRIVRGYTQEFKQEAVTLALKSSSIINTAKELGIPPATLHTWISLLKSILIISSTLINLIKII